MKLMYTKNGIKFCVDKNELLKYIEKFDKNSAPENLLSQYETRFGDNQTTSKFFLTTDKLMIAYLIMWERGIDMRIMMHETYNGLELLFSNSIGNEKIMSISEGWGKNEYCLKLQYFMFKRKVISVINILNRLELKHNKKLGKVVEL